MDSARAAKSGPAKTTDAASRRQPAEPLPAPRAGELVGPEFVLGMQRTAGNRAVQRMLGRADVVQREGDVFYMDASGVAHKEPDKSKAPPVIHMDASGVGHKEPDKSKAPPVIFMDAEGVGHKKPDQSKTPSVLHMDASGVGHKAPDQVAPQVGAALKAIKSNHDLGVAEANTVTTTMAKWSVREVTALAKKAEAQVDMAAGKAHWNVEAADSGPLAATEAAKAQTAAAGARKAYADSDAENAAVGAAETKLNDMAPMFMQNRTRFATDRTVWSKGASPMTATAIKEIGDLIANHGAKALAAVQLAATAAAKLQTLKTTAEEAEAFATEAFKPLRRPANGTFVITGMLQQKLNKTRAAGGRLTVHGLFDSATDTALRAYQAAAGVAVTGTADVPTWTALNADAPSTMRNGQLSVESKEGAQQTRPLNDKIHEDLKFGAKGAGVRELQQRLNNWVGAWPGPGKAPFKPLKVDGSFGFADKSALKAFQKAQGLTETGEADKTTWTRLDAVAGAITTGSRQFDWRESVEGISNVGTTAKYDWEVKDDTITITVKIKFTGSSGHPMVETWLQDIRDIWNAYKAVEVGRVPAREYKIQFNPVKSSSGWHKVRVAKPTKADPNPRSDSGNWYVNDQDKGLAPHEFGHLIGLEDEYNRPEEQAVAASGLEPTVGQVASTTGKTAKEVSDEIHGVITTTAGQPPATRIRQIRAKVQEHGLQQGAFSRLVAAWYRGDHGFGTDPDIASYFATIAAHNWDSDLTWATTPFLVSNQSLMGTMDSLTGAASRTLNVNALPAHQHPVQPRHVRSFANLLSLAVPGTQWEPKRR